MSKYYITVNRVSYEGEKTLVLSAHGVSEDILAIFLKGYNLPGYEINISEIIEKSEGSEQQRWLEGR